MIKIDYAERNTITLSTDTEEEVTHDTFTHYAYVVLISQYVPPPFL